MNAGQPIARRMRALTRLTVAGGALLLAGEMLAVVAAIGAPAATGFPPGAALADVLIAAGLLCGAAIALLGFAAGRGPLARPSASAPPPGAGARRRERGGPRPAAPG